MLSKQQFEDIFPRNRNSDLWLPQFDILPDFNIKSDVQIAIFCATVGHESLDMTVLEENLNYSSIALMRVFRKYFDPSKATMFHRKPEQIANVVYANRMGNGSTASGEGWKYSGKGIIQLTGKNNYRACSKYLYDDEMVLLNDPDLVSDDPSVAMKSALWFWEVNGLSKILDIERVSRRVNGGDHGMSGRISRFERAMKVLS